ncbi:MAG: hypothetical protein IJM54_03430 [Thermoguttaceae bacterium]|nr:hypothetical protein [Thermoguttaceae bacterium]
MTESFKQDSESNPFSTRFTEPGRTPFFFERSFLRQMKASKPDKFEEFFVRALGAGEDIRTSLSVHFLVDKFETHACRGQIVGGHGTGKSSLLHVLNKALVASGYEVFNCSLHDQQRFLPDEFWTDLQAFLQTPPNFLPPKCLLPPPTVSREEYVAQQFNSLRDAFSDDESESANEEFVVSNAAFSEASKQEESKPVEPGPNAVLPPHMEGFFGYNDAGNFGLNRSVVNASSEPRSEADREGSGDFAPFPGVAQPNDPVPESDGDEEYDDVVLDSSERDAAADPKTPAIPVPSDFDLQKRRSFFDKKVVCVDGFEQLSYVSRITLRTFCRMNRLGLLITAHTPAIGVPVLFRTVPCVETLGQLLTFLLEDYEITPDESELETLLKNFNYNVRDILFSLYDAFEKYRLAPSGVREQIIRRFPR